MVRNALLGMIIKRLGRLVVLMFLVTLATTWMLNLVPGSPAVILAGPSATPSVIAAINKKYGFNESVLVQYWHWLSRVFHGDLGRSYQTQQTVTQALSQRVPVSLELTIMAGLIALIIAVPTALYTGYRAGSFADRVVDGVTSSFISIPGFLAGILLAYLLAVKVHVFPAIGWQSLSKNPARNFRTAVLPVVSLSLPLIAIFQRVLRADVIATLQQDYILLARSKGLPTWKILFRHALKPSSFSLLTIAGVAIGGLIGNAVIIEQVYSLPGLGSLLVSSILSKDLVMVQAVIAIIALVYLVLNLLVDIAYTALDPRVAAQ
ncbi:MAG: ABC transporter permease [Acidimicrobiales bacterium]|nr:ABC transporter permease [Acidimicrobiales bacterium]